MPQCPKCFTVHAGESCPADPLVGRTIDGKYRIDALVGRGGMGAVYRARQLALDRDVALKLLHGNILSRPDRQERFKREALAIARLNHPNVVDVYDFSVGSEAGAYLVLEYVVGRALDAEIPQRGRLPVSASLDLMRQIASAVHAAHEAGVVHRDLKPANVLLEVTPSGSVSVKVLDFGIAKLHDPQDDDLAERLNSGELSAEGTLLGTPAYMSHEQCRFEAADARSDVYALGCVLFEMLTGRPPFVAPHAHVLIYKHVAEAPVAPSSLVEGIPPAVDAAVLRALAKAADDRFQTAADLEAALADARSGVETDTSFPPVMLYVSDHTTTTGAQRAVAQRTPTNLPVETSSFVGRHEDLSEVGRLVAANRLVTLYGSGGIGKTRLSLQAAARAEAAFPDGVWFVELAPLADAALVAKAVATAAGVPEQGDVSHADALAVHFASRRALVVLDNCEHVVAATAELADRLLRACPRLHLLATSQSILGVAAETCYRVAPLSLPGVAGADADAEVLFVDRARQQSPAFRVTSENRAIIARICERLEGIPLAIELAAARLRVLSVEQVAERLEHRFRLVAGGSQSAPARHRTLRAALDWSYGLLADDERMLLARLSVFAGSWTLDAVEAVVGAEDVWELLDLMTQLVDKSLLTADARGGEVRYRMLETVREYAAERLAETTEGEALATAHRDFYLGLAERLAPELVGAGASTRLDRLEADHDNLRAALARSAAEPDGAEPLLRIANALFRFWRIRGHRSEAHRWLDRGLAAGTVEPRVRAKALYSLGAIELVLGDLARAEAVQHEASALYESIGDRQGAASALNSLGSIAAKRGDYDLALERYRAAVDGLRPFGPSAALAGALANLGLCYTFLDDGDRAAEVYTDALATGRASGSTGAVAHALMNLGLLALDAGDLDRAAARYDEALEIVAELGDERLRAAVLSNAGDVARLRGDHARAREVLAEAVAMHFASADLLNSVTTIASLASLAAVDGDPGLALTLAGAVDALLAQHGLRMRPHELEDYERFKREAEAAVGEATATRARATGAALSLDDAVALATSHQGRL